jgi:cytochrome c biogenesis protein CcmG/thiol:disulfide interchange protein DsbE
MVGWVAGLVVSGVMDRVGWCAEEAPAKRIWAKSFLGRKAPALTVEKWLGPEPKSSGRWMLIDFWATWCGPCRGLIPELNAFHAQFGERLVVIGLSNEPEKKVGAMKDPVIRYFSAIDTKGRMSAELGITGIPHVILVDPEGVVRWEGYPMLEGFELTAEVIGKLLGRDTPGSDR